MNNGTQVERATENRILILAISWPALKIIIIKLIGKINSLTNNKNGLA